MEREGLQFWKCSFDVKSLWHSTHLRTGGVVLELGIEIGHNLTLYFGDSVRVGHLRQRSGDAQGCLVAEVNWKISPTLQMELQHWQPSLFFFHLVKKDLFQDHVSNIFFTPTKKI